MYINFCFPISIYFRALFEGDNDYNKPNDVTPATSPPLTTSDERHAGKFVVESNVETFQKILTTSVPSTTTTAAVGSNYPFEVTFQGELREIPGVGTVLVIFNF